MLRKILSTIVFLSLFLFAQDAFSQEIKGAIYPLKAGQQAPVSGVLLSPDAVAWVVSTLEAKDAEIKLKVDNAVKEAGVKCNSAIEKQKIELESDKKELFVKLESSEKKIVALDAALAAEKKNRQDPGVWFGIGAGAGVVVGALIASIVASVVK